MLTQDQLKKIEVSIDEQECINGEMATTLLREWKSMQKQLQTSLANNLCSDHRDKQSGKPCLACEVESLIHLVKRAYFEGVTDGRFDSSACLTKEEHWCASIAKKELDEKYKH